MEELWCWRCKQVIPMLDKDEWEEIEPLLSASTVLTKDFRKKHGVPLEGVDTDGLFRPALDAYERLTGFRETNYRALYHHRISIYGPPCEYCGKPLRTPQARLCAACGRPRTR